MGVDEKPDAVVQQAAGRVPVCRRSMDPSGAPGQHCGPAKGRRRPVSSRKEQARQGAT